MRRIKLNNRELVNKNEGVFIRNSVYMKECLYDGLSI